MDFYSNTVPNLISDRIRNSINNISKVTIHGGGDMFKKVYDNYINPNLLLIICVLVIIGFLYYRYKLKSETFEPDKRPVFNPSKSISDQTSYTNYLPLQIPSKINNDFVNDVDEDILIDPEYTTSIVQDKGPEYKIPNIVSDDTINDFTSKNKQDVLLYNNYLSKHTTIEPENNNLGLQYTNFESYNDFAAQQNGTFMI